MWPADRCVVISINAQYQVVKKRHYNWGYQLRLKNILNKSVYDLFFLVELLESYGECLGNLQNKLLFINFVYMRTVWTC